MPTMGTDDIKNFWAKIRVCGSEDCWPWTSTTFSFGHGCFYFKYKLFKASRIAYYITYGIDPGNFMVLHNCDNPACCNPKHLSLGTTQDNTRDRTTRGRSAIGDKNGSRKHPEKLARGERSGMSKLTEYTIKDIKQQHSLGKSGAELAREFGINKSTACRIIKGKSWAHMM